MTDNNTRQQTLLDQYWDADPVNRVYIPDELDASLRETVDQFHAADDAPAPDREFVDRLWTDLAGGTPAASAATQPWTDEPNDEPTEPQYVAERQEDPLQAKQQSRWRHRARQIGELVAGVLVLALVTGVLILAYQNLIGEGEGSIPGAGDEQDGMVPTLSSAGAISWDGDILQRDGIGSVEIGRFDDQDYALIFTVPGTQAGTDSGPVLRSVRLDQSGQHEQVSSLELDVPWTSSFGVAMGTMALVDDVLYLPVAADERPGIWAVDVSDPENPNEIAFIDIEAGYPITVAGSSDGMLVAATFDGPVYFLDISDLEQPEIVAEAVSDEFGFRSTVEAPRMTFDDDRLYVAHYEGVSIVDVSESAEPEVVGRIANPDFDPTGSGDTNGSSLHGPIPGDAWHDVLLIDDTAYVAAGDDGVRIFEVADPSAPMEIGQIEREDRTGRLVESNGFVYVLGVSAYDEPDQQGLDWTWSVDVFDVSDPETPETVDRLPDLSGGTEDEDFLQVNTRHLVTGQDFLLTFGYSGSLVAHIDWVEPTDDVSEEIPTPEASDEDVSDLVPSLASTGVIDQHGELLQGAEVGSIEIARVDGQDYAFMLLFPPPDGSDEAYPTIRTLRLDPGGEHVVAGDLELDVDWSGPMQFNMGKMALVDDVLFAPIPIEDQPGIWTIDVSDPDTPQEISFLDVEADWPMTVVASDDTAVATGMFGNIYFFLDISDPAEPVLSSQLEGADIELHSSAELPALTMDGDTLYIAHPRGVTMLDVSNPANPAGLAAIENPDWEGLEGVEGAGTDTQIQISDEDSMLDRSVRPDAYHGVAVSGDHAYVAAGDAGVLVFDVSDPSDPQELETLERDDRTVRVTQFDEYVHALGVSSEGDDREQPVWAWSVDALDISEPDDPQIVHQLENLVPAESADDAAGFFLMSSIRQAVSGQDFYLAWGRAGAYVAQIDWVEATGNEEADDAVEEEAAREDQPAIDTDDLTVYFPRQSEDVNEYDDGAPVGTLAMDERGCLRFGDEEGPLIIWPYEGFSVDMVDDEVALINDETGNVVAYVGEEVPFHGSDPAAAPDSVPDHMLKGPLPEACADAGRDASTSSA